MGPSRHPSSEPAPQESEAPAEDFTQEPLPASEPELTAEPGEEFDPSRHREKLRGELARGLLLLLAGVIAATFITLWMGLATSDVVLRILELILGPVVTLVSAATGFYYGSANGGHRPEQQ